MGSECVLTVATFNHGLMLLLNSTTLFLCKSLRLNEIDK